MTSPGSNKAISGVAAGVPFVALPPANPGPMSPTVFAWHLLDAPCSETAFAAAIPLDGLDAWRIYFGLPMCGTRMPEGGYEELTRLAIEDDVLNLMGPISSQALAEFGPAYAELKTRLNLGSGPIGLVGGSLGGAIALLVLLEAGLKVDAVVLLNPMVHLRAGIDAMAREYDVVYEWPPEALVIAERLDFVAKAAEIAAKQEPALLIISGDADNPGFRLPAIELQGELARLYSDPNRTVLSSVSGLAHALGEAPGIEPAPQNAHAAEVDRLAAEWLGRHLV